MEIPKKLQKHYIKFIKLASKSKKPIDKEWTTNPNVWYSFNDKELLNHLEKKGNYGVLCGEGDLIVIDSDSKELTDYIKKNFPKSLTILTGSNVDYKNHFYFKSKDTTSVVLKKINQNGSEEHFGEIQGKGKQVVGPNCIHPSGNPYKIEKNLNITLLKRDELEKLKQKFCGKEVLRAKRNKKIVKGFEKDDIESNLNIVNIIDIEKLKKSNLKNYYIGSHPVHDSTTGTNFHIDADENIWYCFRCNSGGGVASLIAVKEGLINCSEAKVKLTKEIYKKVLEISKIKYGFDTSNSNISKEKIEDLKNLSREDFGQFCIEVRLLYGTGKRKETKEGERLIVEYLLDNFHFLTPKDCEVIYVYKEGIYEGIGEVLIKEIVQKILEGENSNHITNEIIGHIKRSSYIDRDNFVEPLNLICLKNGLLNTQDLNLESFNPDYIFLNKLPVNYDKEKTCFKVIKFIKEIIISESEWNREDADKTNIITLQEFCGFLLLKQMKFHRALMLYGEGQNGKSTFINLIKKFLGEKNVSNVPIQKLERDKFAVASLHGKLANLHSDLPKTALREASVFKQLTGDDSIDGERKFKDNFSFLNYAKMLYAANTLPEAPEDTTAFWRRWIMIKFPNQFSEKGKNTKKNLIGELANEDELSGFLNWSIEGLKRLLENDEFTLNKSTEEIREIYIRQSDSVMSFILDCVVESKGKGDYIIKADLYESYVSYCRKEGYEILADNAFHRKFRSKVDVREYQPSILVNGKPKQPKAWAGIKLRVKGNDISDY
ncbi:MAG: phage/plasmid primase, P4 family [archaeon]